MTNENNNNGQADAGSWAQRVSGEVQHERGQEEGHGYGFVNEPVIKLSDDDRKYLNAGIGGLGSVNLRRAVAYGAVGGRLIVGGLAGAGAMAVVQSKLPPVAKYAILGAAIAGVFFKRDRLF